MRIDLPDPFKVEESDGPPIVRAFVIGVPITAAFFALATYAPDVLMVGFFVLTICFIAWGVGVVVLLLTGRA